MRFAELFAGAGGLSMGLEWAGHECVWHAEIEPHARAVLRHRWPTVPLYGDVSQLNGKALVAAHGPIDLLTGGSPCQDLSVAGKRAGLEGKRSGLFYQQVRLWRETGADLLLWENVMGALSSQGGADFHTVLEELSGTSCARPDDGWPTAGVIHGPDGRARVAYRSLDLQWFGPPQRRRRVFVCAVAPHALDRYDPAALLFTDAVGGCAGACGAGTLSPEPHRLRWHPAPGGTAGEGATADAGTGAAFAWDKFNVTSATNRTRVISDVSGNEVAQTLRGFGHGWQGQHNTTNAVVTGAAFGWDERNVTSATNRTRVIPGLVPTLHERGMHVAAEGVHTVDGAQGQAVVAFRQDADGCVNAGDVVNAIATNANASGRATQMVVVFQSNGGGNDAPSTDGVSPTLKVGSGIGVPSPVGVVTFSTPAIGHIVEDDVASTISANTTNAVVTGAAICYPLEPSRLSKTNSNIGVGSASDPMFTLQRHHHHGVVAFRQNADGCVNAGDVVNAIATNAHASGRATQMVVAFQSNGGGNDAPSTDGVSPTLKVGSGIGVPSPVGVVAWWDGRDTAPTLDQSQLVKGQMMPEKDRFPVVMDNSWQPRPRRLTPLECERLMGWPDQHTAHGVKEDGTAYALPDSARYRLCGNGVGSPITAWIGRMLGAA